VSVHSAIILTSDESRFFAAPDSVKTCCACLKDLRYPDEGESAPWRESYGRRAYLSVIGNEPHIFMTLPLAD